MRFLHIADLHLGKRLRETNLLEDQEQVLNQILDLAKANHADAVLIAGDVYQKASPQSEAMTVFNRFITSLCEAGIASFIISGNHDSDQRISYFSALLRKAGVYVSDTFNGTLQSIHLTDEHGPITVHLLPFVKPITVRRCFPNDRIETYQDAVESILAHSSVDTTVRNVLVAHQFITGSTSCDSEEMSVGGLDNIDAYLFNDFDYVALGHVHMPQQCGRKTCRYAGSIMKYSQSEAQHHKNALLVDVGPKGSITVTPLPLQMPHDLRNVTGPMNEIMAMPYSEDYVYITLTDELVPPDARVTLSTVFPNMMGLTVKNSRTKEDRDILAGDIQDRKDWQSLFRDFYALQNNDQAVPEKHMAMLLDIAREVQEDGYEAD